LWRVKKGTKNIVMKIALIEDEPAIGEMLMMALELAGGYTVVSWTGGAGVA
jgi:DNA-binding response OmpR family regulator